MESCHCCRSQIILKGSYRSTCLARCSLDAAVGPCADGSVSYARNRRASGSALSDSDGSGAHENR